MKIYFGRVMVPLLPSLGSGEILSPPIVISPEGVGDGGDGDDDDDDGDCDGDGVLAVGYNDVMLLVEENE